MRWTQRSAAARVGLMFSVLTPALTVFPSRASGAQLTAAWIDNSNGFATTRLERRVETETAFVVVADVTPGVTRFIDVSVEGGVTYCYRALAHHDEHVVSPYSDEACATAGDTASALRVAVSKIGDGAGTVVSSPPGIECGDACAATYDAALPVTLTAFTDGDAVFLGWSGDCTGTAACTVAGNVAVSVTATFMAPSSDDQRRAAGSDCHATRGAGPHCHANVGTLAGAQPLNP